MMVFYWSKMEKYYPLKSANSILLGKENVHDLNKTGKQTKSKKLNYAQMTTQYVATIQM